MLYILKVTEDNETFDYEYGNIEHAEEQYKNEKSAQLFEYNNGKYNLIKAK